jgi:hypothetical protein
MRPNRGALPRLAGIPILPATVLNDGFFKGPLKLLAKLKLESLQIIPGLIIYWLRNADFERAHGRNPHDSQSGRIAQSLAFRNHSAWAIYRSGIYECA